MVTAQTGLSPAVLADLRRRCEAGESLAALAAEVGMSWQRLWGLLQDAEAAESAGAGSRPSPWKGPADDPPLEPHGSGSLVERYRPQTLEAIWGQRRAVRALKRFAANPYPAAFLFEGATGTGKTTAALALARAIGCAVEHGEWGGVWEIASGEQTADAVRNTARRMRLHPRYGAGWRVVVANEADRLNRPAEVVWLDLLEHLPKRAVVVFTTNDPGRLPARFRDRCVRVRFESDPDALWVPACRLAARVWERETGRRPDPARIEAVVRKAIEAGTLSFRRVLRYLEEALIEENE